MALRLPEFQHEGLRETERELRAIHEATKNDQDLRRDTNRAFLIGVAIVAGVELYRGARRVAQAISRRNRQPQLPPGR